MLVLIILSVWTFFPFVLVNVLARLQAIPPELYDAARVDGAGAWARFVHVTLPSLAPTFLFVGLITMIGQFQLFAEPYVMTQGGPGDATRSLVLLMYEQGFRWWSLGHAAAIAFVLFAIVAAFTAVARFVTRERAA